MRHIAPGNINWIKRVFYVFFPSDWRVPEPHPTGQGQPWQFPPAPHPQSGHKPAPRHGLTLTWWDHKEVGLRFKVTVGLTHNIALPHFTKAILSSKWIHNTSAKLLFSVPAIHWTFLKKYLQALSACLSCPRDFLSTAPITKLLQCHKKKTVLALFSSGFCCFL